MALHSVLPPWKQLFGDCHFEPDVATFKIVIQYRDNLESSQEFAKFAKLKNLAILK